MTEDNIADILNQSDFDDGSEASDDDSSFIPQTNDREANSESSSYSSSDDDPIESAPASPVLSVNSERPGRTRTRGRRGGRRGLLSRSRIIRSSTVGNADRQNCWIGEKLEPNNRHLQQPAYLPKDTSNWEYYEYIRQYIDDDILDIIVECTNRTEVLLKGKTLGLTKKELMVYFGITMVMSALQYPKIDMYWMQKWRVPTIASAMTRIRFYAIRTRLKCVFDLNVSDENRRNDKIWKIRPFFDRILKGCLAQDRPENVCVDEMIIPFSGQCKMRQYCPNKPNPVGLKVFVLATPDGIVCDMIIYQGDTTCPDLINQGFGLGESMVLYLTRSLVPGHKIFFDRYFTTIKLCDELMRLGFHGTGTIMRNRIPRDCVFSDEKNFKKQPRGTTEVRIRSDETLAATMWLDKKPVLMLSSRYCNENTDECQRWSKQRKTYERVQRPEVVQVYNKNMGGVDLTDRMLSICPSRNRTKKWTIRVISHFFDLAVVNSWLQYRQQKLFSGKKLSEIEQLREFKLNLGCKWIEDNDESSDGESDPNELDELLPQHKKRKITIVPLPSLQRRQQKAAHLPDYGPKQARCRNSGCDKKKKNYSSL